MHVCKSFRKLVGDTHRGITLVEVIVVVGILGILLSLSFVGVQSARESSRRVQCESNMRQIGLPIMEEAGTGRLPKVRAVKFTQPGSSNPIFGNPLVLAAQKLSHLVTTVSGNLQIGDDSASITHPPPILRCPSANSLLGYRLSFGVEPRFTFAVRDTNGQLFSLQKNGRLISGVTDGLSHTIFISERVTMDQRVRHEQAIALANGVPGFEQTNAYCETAFQNNRLVPNGEYWWSTDIYCFGYDHTRAPNSPMVDCFVANQQAIVTSWMTISARSQHPHLVCCGALDGSIRWCSSSIDLQVWRAIGTPDGGETDAGETP